MDETKNTGPSDIEENNQEDSPKWVLWLKRIGVVGFLFFLIKGLVWLAIFYFAGKSFF